MGGDDIECYNTVGATVMGKLSVGRWEWDNTTYKSKSFVGARETWQSQLNRMVSFYYMGPTMLRDAIS